MNKVVLSGFLGRDPETKHTNDGNSITSFSLGVNVFAKGEKLVDWYNCTAFGKTAEFVQKYLNKGSHVFVDGKIRLRQYDAREGVKKMSVDVSVDNIEFAGNKQSGGGKQDNKQTIDGDVPF